jgi:uncharacterized membrane protein
MSNSLVSAFLAAGLVATWLAGLFTSTASPWISWLHALAAVWSALISAEILPNSNRPEQPALLGLGLVVLGAVAIATEQVLTWQTWFTLIYAAAFLALAASCDFSLKSRIKNKKSQANSNQKRAA